MVKAHRVWKFRGRDVVLVDYDSTRAVHIRFVERGQLTHSAVINPTELQPTPFTIPVYPTRQE